MKVIYNYKYHNHIYHQELHPFYLRIIEACLADFRAVNIGGEINIVFQTAPSLRRDRLYGICYHNHYARYGHLIRVYAYYRWTRTIGRTIAHEFGHIRHFELEPESRFWSKQRCEDYANWYENTIYKQVI